MPLRIELAPLADLTADPDTYSWTDVTHDWHRPTPIVLTVGGADEQTETASTLEFALRDNDGRYVSDNPMSDLWPGFVENCPVRISRDPLMTGTWVQQCVQYISKVTHEWPGNSGHLCITRIGADGLLRRLQQGEEIRSPPLRYLAGLTGTVPVASWALEDGPLVSAGAPVHGAYAMTPFVGRHPSGAVVTYPQWGQGTLAPWLPSVISRSGSGGLTILRAQVAMPAFTDTWAVDFAFSSGTDGPVSAVDVNPSYLGGALGWPQLTLDPLVEQILVAFDAAETSVVVSDLFDGGVHHVRWTCTQNGADVDWSVYVDAVLVLSGTETTYTLAAITALGLTVEATSAATALGYVSVWTAPAAVADYTAAIFGHQGEMAHERVARVCTEKSVPYSVTADASTRLGPQPLAGIVAILRDTERTDRGILDDSQGRISYRAHSELYNQTPIMTIDGSDRELFAPYAPTLDDQTKRNDTTASRPDGASAREVDTAHVAAKGRYSGDLPVDVQDDAQLRHHAGWRNHEGTVEGYRYPSVTLKLHVAPRFVASILAARPGDVVRATGLPRQQRGELDLMLRGWTDVMVARRSWIFVANCHPAQIYEVFEIEGAGNRGRLQQGKAGGDPASMSFVVNPHDAVDTTMLVETPATSRRWITDSIHPTMFPFLIICGNGEVMNATGISSATNSQTFTVTRSINGVIKAIAAGDTIQLYRPGVTALSRRPT
jgi:hypothetical protein